MTHHDDQSLAAIEPEADKPLRSSAVLIPLISLFAVLLLVIGVAAVATGGDEEVDAATLLASAPDAAREAGTARMTMTTEGAPMSVTGRGFVDLVNGNSIFEMDLLGSSMEVRLIDGTMYMRLPAEARTAGIDKEWIGMDVPGMPEGGLGMTASPGGYVESLRGVTGEIEELGEQAVNGMRANGYRVVVDLDLAIAELPDDQRAEIEPYLDDARAMGMDEYPMEVWLTDDGLPVRMTMEVSPAGAPDPIRVQVDLTEFGVDVEFEAPPEEQILHVTDPSELGSIFGAESAEAAA